MTHYIFMGLILGASAGLSPGPLLTLVISETLARGKAAGIRVALAPLISDLPIVVITLAVLTRLANFNPVLGVISLVGGAVILKMGIAGLKTAGAVPDTKPRDANPLYKGIMVNILSPHPYLFWLTIGGPTTTRAWDIGPGAAMGFVAGFYVLLIGSKICLALVTGRTRSFMKGKVYVYTMKGLGAVLCILAFVLVWEGLGLLGWV